MEPHYRVAIFGSSRIKQEDREYDDLQGVFLLDSPAGVVDLIRRIQEDRSRGASVCVNFEKYRV